MFLFTVRCEFDAAIFNGKKITPLLCGIKFSSAHRFGVVAGIENFLASIPDAPAVLQGEDDNALAINTVLDVAERRSFGTGC